MQHKRISSVLVIPASVPESDLHVPIRCWTGLYMHHAKSSGTGGCVDLFCAVLHWVESRRVTLWDVHLLLLSTKGGCRDVLHWEEG